MSTISTRRRIVTFKNSLFHFGSAVRDSMIAEKYTRARFFKDLLAGITVGIIAIPLSMALAIATGVNPEYGLYTALVAGIVIALTGGSRYSISGPTAAFVVILAQWKSRNSLVSILSGTAAYMILIRLLG